MIAFDTPTRSMVVALAGAAATTEPSWISSWEDAVAVGTDFGVTTGATEVTIVPAPSEQATGTRKLASFSLYNRDTAAVVVTVTYRDSIGPSSHILQSITLQAGESMIYEQNSGWSGLDTNGNTKVASNNVNVSTALSMATVASSAASNATVSVSTASSANSRNSLSVSAASSAASLGVLGSSQAASMHAAFSVAASSIDEANIASLASRVKSSFGW